MALSKKHFEQFALLVLNRKSTAEQVARLPDAKEAAIALEGQARATMLDLISICEDENPRFDRARFVKACGF